MNSFQRSLGSVLLGAVLTFGAYGVVVNALEGEPTLYEQNDLYLEECGACHLAYAPDLLPVASWQAIMADLDNHFGDNAELDVETGREISSYLELNGLTRGRPSRMSRLLRNLPEPPPLRITELPAFVNMHYMIPQQLDVAELAEGFLSPCEDCHREAALGIYDRDRLHPGYGPDVWGGRAADPES
jgi:hypothetical protein